MRYVLLERLLPLYAALAVACPLVHADGPPPIHEDFEQGELANVPAGWFVPTAQMGGAAAIVEVRPAAGRRCVEVSKEGTQAFGNLMRTIDAAPYRGLHVRFGAHVRSEVGGPAGRAQLWMRVDRAGGRAGFFDNMGDRPIRSARWGQYEILGEIADDAETINIGLMVIGQGKAWLDDVTLEVVNADEMGWEPPRPLSDRGLANLITLSRLIGYVRHFHPADEAAEADWDRIAIDGVRAVESAGDAEELATALRVLLAPIAPGVDVWTGAALARGPAPGAGVIGFVRWEHSGFGPQAGAAGEMRSNIYRSWRVRTQHDEVDLDNGAVPGPGDLAECDLGGGVRSRVPLCVPYGAAGTLPRPQERAERGESDDFITSPNDRGTRLAAVILGWNVLEFFYPYFDVVPNDWSAVLPEALRRAAEDPNDEAFYETLQWFVGRIDDGHGRVVGPGARMSAYRLPFVFDWVGEQLVVTVARRGEVHAGDAVVALDGRAPRAIYDELAPRISAATEQWKRWRALQEISMRSSAEPFIAEFERPDGSRYSIRAPPIAARERYREPRPDKIAELAPGIWYVDLDRVVEADFEQAIPELAQATGIVFDLRGYPSGISTAPIAHLIDEPASSAQWHVPVVRWPDRERMTFGASSWSVEPQAPRFTSRVAFITDGRAISYAETYMGIIEHYEIAEIVGAPTAGTNGNVNAIALPGGYRITFTGMKVLKHDGARHHGVGILPTTPVHRTIEGIAAGRDELLERAVEVVSQKE